MLPHKMNLFIIGIINMQVIILAGGFGTRLSEYTDIVPKPMVEICGKPILIHIMEHYAHHGFKDFILALGYKSNYIKEYFSNLQLNLSDFFIDFSSGKVSQLNKPIIDWRVNLIDTGLNTMTGGRLKRLQSFVDDDNFMLTYGDGVCDVDIQQLLNFHLAHGQLATVTAVRPSARFGELSISDENHVKKFQEKPRTEQGWVNGGFMVFKREVFEYLDDDTCVLEREPMQKLARDGQLMAYKHTGFWQCMDTKRDKDYLEATLAHK